MIICCNWLFSLLQNIVHSLIKKLPPASSSCNIFVCLNSELPIFRSWPSSYLDSNTYTSSRIPVEKVREQNHTDMNETMDFQNYSEVQCFSVFSTISDRIEHLSTLGNWQIISCSNWIFSLLQNIFCSLIKKLPPASSSCNIGENQATIVVATGGQVRREVGGGTVVSVRPYKLQEEEKWKVCLRDVGLRCLQLPTSGFLSLAWIWPWSWLIPA